MLEVYQTLERNPSPAALRGFGWQLLSGFAGSGLLWMLVVRGLAGRWVPEIFFVLGGLGATGAVLVWVSPRVGRRVHRGWGYLRATLELVVGGLALGLVYFLVITPMGWVRRTFGRTGLLQGPVTAEVRPTYWREPAGPQPPSGQTYYRQF